MTAGTPPHPLADGLWRWTARHPEWHPGEFGREVASYALRTDEALLLVDPLIPDDPAAAAAVHDLIARERDRLLAVLITIPYHVRSSEAIRNRYGSDGEVQIWGHRAVAPRMVEPATLHEIEPGAELPGGARAYAIGRPRRQEMPIHLPSHSALAFGDAVVEVDGELRMWTTDHVAERSGWYHEVFAPTLAPLVDLDAERILVTHGEPILEGGAAALRAALESPPWYQRG